MIVSQFILEHQSDRYKSIFILYKDRIKLGNSIAGRAIASFNGRTKARYNSFHLELTYEDQNSVPKV